MELKNIHIILDIDGTLIDEDANPRPDLKYFFDFCFNSFASVNIWTAANKEWYEYVNEKVFIKLLDKNKFGFVWCGDRCSIGRNYIDGFYPETYKTKRLRKIWKTYKQMNKNNTLILDDTPKTYSLNYGNAIPIPTFENNNMKDDMLIKLTKWISIFNMKPLRYCEKRFWFILE